MEDSIQELKEDLTDLRILVDGASTRLAKFSARLATHPEFTAPESREALKLIIESLSNRYVELRSQIIDHTRETRDLSTLSAFKRATIHTLHVLQGILGSLLASTDWQSPSFLHTEISEAGMQTGKIVGTVSDYKRDFHKDSTAYEQAFKEAYLDVSSYLPVTVSTTSSGMAALSTILAAMRERVQGTGPIFVGEHCYFQNKILLRNEYGDRIRFFDELDTDGLLTAIEHDRPSAVFIDALCNTVDVPVPDLAKILNALAKVSYPLVVVLDASGIPTGCIPLPKPSFFAHHFCLVVFESLNKYHQYGLDRVTGGVMWTVGFSAPSLHFYRMHQGTTMPDASTLSLPEPNKPLLARRLAREERNAQYLAEALEVHLASKHHTLFQRIVYPGLPSHPSYAWAKDLPFKGSFLTIALKPTYRWTIVYEHFLKALIAEARKAGIPLNAGSSFGLHTTRVYLTALHAKKGDAEPFLRISLGTESKAELEALAQVFIHVIDRLSTFAILP